METVRVGLICIYTMVLVCDILVLKRFALYKIEKFNCTAYINSFVRAEGYVCFTRIT